MAGEKLGAISGATTTTLSQVNVPGLTYTAAPQQLLLRLQVTGTSPTTVRAKVWLAGTAEPAAWLLTSTDSTAGLQAPGGVGVKATTPAELRSAMEEAVRSRRPTLINAVIDEGAGTESGRITSLNPTAKKK